MEPPQAIIDAEGPLETEHPAGCTYGGFSCGYWLIADSCDLEHWERHIVRDDTCPCGHTYPDAGTTIVLVNPL